MEDKAMTIIPAHTTATQLTIYCAIAAGLPMPLEGTVAVRLATLARARHSGVSPIRDAARALTASLAAFLASPVGIVDTECNHGPGPCCRECCDDEACERHDYWDGKAVRERMRDNSLD
jgi:hypothetical protein